MVRLNGASLAKKVARAHGYQGDMRDLTRGQALEILEADYWYGIIIRPG